MAYHSNSPGPQFERLYSKWAHGGCGLVISGNGIIDSRALGEPHNVVTEKTNANVKLAVLKSLLSFGIGSLKRMMFSSP